MSGQVKSPFWSKNITTYEILIVIQHRKYWCLPAFPTWDGSLLSNLGSALIFGNGQLTESSQVTGSVPPGELLHTAGPPLFPSLLTATFRGDLTNPSASAFSWGATIFLNGCANYLQCSDPLCKCPQWRQNETPLSSVWLPFQGVSMENSCYTTSEWHLPQTILCLSFPPKKFCIASVPVKRSFKLQLKSSKILYTVTCYKLSNFNITRHKAKYEFLT